MNLLPALVCLGIAVVTNGASLPEIFQEFQDVNDKYTLYYPPSSQVLRDSDSPVLLATYDPNSYAGVKYSTAPGYTGVPEQETPVDKRTLSQEIAHTFKYADVYPFEYEHNFISNGQSTKTQGLIRFYGNGTYSVEHYSGVPLTISKDEIVEYYYRDMMSAKEFNWAQTVYPEILVIVHNDLFQSLGADIDKTVEYVTEFWAKVDTRFRGLHSPQVRLNIAGIVIAQSDNATPYIAKPINNGIWDTSYINASGYFHHQPYLKDFYDLVAVMIKIPEEVRSQNGTYIAGQATDKANCRPLLITPDIIGYSGVALIGDDGWYDGVIHAAHEVGHMLGAPHDDDVCPKDPKVTYIMAPVHSNENDIKLVDEFSTCTTKKIENHLYESAGACFYNKPMIKKSPRQTLRKLSTRDVCKRHFGKQYEPDSKINNEMCTSKLKCFDNQHNDDKNIKIVENLLPDGTICGEGKVCLKYHCVTEPVLYVKN